MTMTEKKWSCTSTDNTIIVGRASHEPPLTISFQRTIRVPDNGGSSGLPPDLGKFTLYKVGDYATRLPKTITAKGGVFFSMHRKSSTQYIGQFWS